MNEIFWRNYNDCWWSWSNLMGKNIKISRPNEYDRKYWEINWLDHDHDCHDDDNDNDDDDHERDLDIWLQKKWGDIYIAYSLSYNILKNQQKSSWNNGDIARKRQECRIQIWEKVISHKDYTQKVMDQVIIG